VSERVGAREPAAAPAPADAPAPREAPIGGLRLMARVLWARLKRLFKRR
jgi:hypothetical protein